MSTQEDAIFKVWRIPELVETLLVYLDPASILSLVGLKLLNSHTLETASKTKNPVKKLIKKALELDQRKSSFEEHRHLVKGVSSSLLAKLENPNCDQLHDLVKVEVLSEEVVEENWSVVARILQRHPGRRLIFSSKEVMQKARREDLRSIWDAMQGGPSGLPSSWSLEGRNMELRVRTKFTKACLDPEAEEKSETTWTELLEFLDAAEPEIKPMHYKLRGEIGKKKNFF